MVQAFKQLTNRSPGSPEEKKLQTAEFSPVEGGRLVVKPKWKPLWVVQGHLTWRGGNSEANKANT